MFSTHFEIQIYFKYFNISQEPVIIEETLVNCQISDWQNLATDHAQPSFIVLKCVYCTGAVDCKLKLF